MPQILMTIDTEIGELGKYRPDAFDVFVEGKINNKEVGYKFIMDLLEKYNIKGEFFVDIYPYKQVGEEKFVKLCQNIVKRGHNVQLHTHPSMAFDEKRIHINQYSLEEQIKILKFGKEKIKDWIGKYPIAHRAGGYGINKNTFKALEKVGIFYDSSYFYRNGNCKFQCDIKNKPFIANKVVEIPISVFKKIIKNNFLGVNIATQSYFQKMDIRYGADVKEIQEVISKSNDDNIIVLFLHSFNFLKLPYDFRKKRYKKIAIYKELIEKFENLLEWLSLQENCYFTNFDKLKINFFQKDNSIMISKKKNILLTKAHGFRNKILKTRKT